MLGKRIQVVVVTLAALGLLFVGVAMAETWHLEKGSEWKSVSAQGGDKYLLAVSEIKKLVVTGQTDAVAAGFDKLGEDFPEISGEDIDAFVLAEILFSQGDLTGAVRSYDDFMVKFPRSWLYEVALDREFAIAKAFLGGEKKPVLKVFKIRGYAEGEKIMDRIIDRAGIAPIGLIAATAVAESYEQRNKFEDAYLRWSQVSSQWPTGSSGKESILAMARCKHQAYKGPKYDATTLVSAKGYYEKFQQRYRQDAKELEIGKKLDQIEEQLAYKQFVIGEYYQEVGNKQSANFYYQMVAGNWPDTEAGRTAKAAMIAGEQEEMKKEKGWKQKTIQNLEKLFL